MAGSRTLPGGAAGPVAGGALAVAGGTIAPATYVRLCGAHAVITDEDSLIVVGGRQRQRLTGVVGELVLRLFPLLDGGRRVGDIAGLLGLGAAELVRALSVLQEAGLVECGDAPLTSGRCDVPEYAAAFLSRVVHTTGRYRNSQEQLAALSAAAVLVVGDGPVGDAVRADLRSCGAGRVIGGEPHRPAAIAEAVEALAAADTACRRHAVPLLRGARQDALIEVGPLFCRDHTACARCWQRGRAGLPGAWTSASAQHAGPGDIGAVAADQVLAAMLVDEAVAVLGCVRAISPPGTVLMASLTDGTERTLLALPYSDCPRCGDLLASSDPADAAAAFE